MANPTRKVVTSETSDIINIHFDDNRKRQGLTTTPDPSSSAAVIISNTAQTTSSSAAVTDKSRKGSIDTKIMNLVALINNNHTSLSSSSSQDSKSTTTTTTTMTSSPVSIKNPVVDQDKDESGSWNYFTTSSCSGRAILFTHHDQDFKESTDDAIKHDTDQQFQNLSPADTEEPLEGFEDPSIITPQFRKTNQKKGCKWLYVTHDEIDKQEFFNCWNELPEGTYAVFKVEPSIFHIQCRTLSSAKELIHVSAAQSGFRNSGMVIGKDGKITVAVRSTIGLEVPLPIGKDDVNPIVPDKFLDYLITTGNQTLQENWKRTEKFETEFQKYFFNRK